MHGTIWFAFIVLPYSECRAVFLSCAAEDRQWALHKALHSINVEMNRASASGVAVWFPMGISSRQRVVRLAYNESVLLNSREKAPFTLCVEVLNEAAAEAEVAQATGKEAGLRDAAALPPLPPVAQPPPKQEMALDPAAAEAAAGGIPWVPHHHRRNSSHDTQSSATLAAAAMAAVQGSSAAAKGPTTPSVNGDVPRSPPSDVAPTLATIGKSISGAEVGAAHPSGMPAGSTTSLLSQRSDVSFATDISLADFASEASHSPPTRRPMSGSSASTATEDHAVPGHQGYHGSAALPPLPKGHVQGGGTWIGAQIKGHQHSTPPPSGLHTPPPHDLTSGLSAAMAGLRGEAPLVMVRLQVIDDVPLCTTPSAQSSISIGSDLGDASASEHVSGGSPVGTPSRAAVHPEPVAGAVQAGLSCPRNSWMCKIGLCKACSALKEAREKGEAEGTAPLLDRAAVQTLASVREEESPEPNEAPAPHPQPRVKVFFTVQGGLSEFIEGCLRTTTVCMFVCL